MIGWWSLFLCIRSNVLLADKVEEDGGVTKDSDETESTFNERMKRWYRESGRTEGELPGRIASTKGMGRGLYASRDVKEGEVVISVPLEDVVCEKTVGESIYADAFRTVSSGTDRLALYVLAEKYNPKSRFASWFPLMPKEFESPPFFTDEEIELLRGDDIYDQAKRMREDMRQSYAFVRKEVLTKHPDIFGGEDSCCTYEEYAWARHMIESRAWHLRGRQYLVPMADFFNHEPHPSQQVEGYVPDVRGEFFLKHHRIVDGYAEVIADRPTKMGEQMFETYGDNTNFIYLMYHGFVPDVNPYECVDFVLPDLFRSQPSESVRRSMIDAVQKLGLRSRKFCVKNDPNAYEIVWAFARVRSFENRDDLQRACTKALQTIGSNDPRGAVDALRRCAPMDQDARNEIVRRLRKMIAAYPKEIGTETSILDRGLYRNKRERWAYRYVVERKKILLGLAQSEATRDEL